MSGWIPTGYNDDVLQRADPSRPVPPRPEPTGRWAVFIAAPDVVEVRADDRESAINAVYSMLRDDPGEFTKIVARELK